MNETTGNNTADQAAAFQKIWLESISKILNTAFAFGSDSPPPDILREIRSGMFQALGKSWEEFMRSPEFLDSMKQWMDSAVAFRKMSNDFMANARNEMQATSRDDIDTIMLTIRHMEKRLLDRVEELSAQVQQLQGAAKANGPQGSRRATGPKQSANGGRRRSRRPHKTGVS